jgi:hypothetical protein
VVLTADEVAQRRAVSDSIEIIDGYTLLFAALLLFAGNLSDRIGAKRALAVGITIFTMTSAASALAPSTAGLIAARCAQGAGAAIMLPASMALVREAFPDPGRQPSGACDPGAVLPFSPPANLGQHAVGPQSRWSLPGKPFASRCEPRNFRLAHSGERRRMSAHDIAYEPSPIQGWMQRGEAQTGRWFDCAPS